MKFLKIALIILVLLSFTYILGPKVNSPDLDLSPVNLDIPLEEIDNYIAEQEFAIDGLKPDNEARIVWVDSVKQKTTYSIVYLHGFSASPMEGSPVHKEIARKFGANLYLARLYGHGIDSEEAFLDLTPQKLFDSAKEALAVGSLLGDSVILMSCSTGGTLSVFLAAESEHVHSQILYSPNIKFAKAGADMLTKPWGLQLARLMFKGKYRSLEAWPEMAPYWTMRYRLEGLINVKSLVEKTMTKETFQKIEQPLFLGYYFKNDEEQDHIVSVPDMLNLYNSIRTPAFLKRQHAFANVNSHVITSDIQSSDVIGVIEETAKFCSEVLRMPERKSVD